MYENILLPFDGSEGAAEVLHHASEFAHWADATVQVLYVADTTRDSVTVVSEAETRGVTNTVRHVERGTPAEVIRDSVESNDIHAVGMGTTGRRGTDRILLGSVAEKTVRSAPVPVVTVAEPT